MSERRRLIANLLPGDVFSWCNVTVELVFVEPVKAKRKRSARWLHVAEIPSRGGEGAHRLHYWDDETVELR